MAMTLIADNTADTTDLATVSFTSGIDSTYKLYIFKFFDINPANDGTAFSFNGSIDGGSNYNVTKTTTYFQALAGEAGGGEVIYVVSLDHAQQTGFQPLSFQTGNGSDEGCAGTLWLFNPSNTTYVKHFYATVSSYRYSNDATVAYIGGYFNDTNDIDAIQFKCESGNMDGVIKMYGVS